jgi:hypothetical protein
VFCYRNLVDRVLSVLVDTLHMHLALTLSIHGTHTSNDTDMSMFLLHCQAPWLDPHGTTIGHQCHPLPLVRDLARSVAATTKPKCVEDTAA